MPMKYFASFISRENSVIFFKSRNPRNKAYPCRSMASHAPTSVILDNLLQDAPSDHITLEWIIDRLGERSFGILMLLIALVGLVPVVSSIAGLILALPASLGGEV